LAEAARTGADRAPAPLADCGAPAGARAWWVTTGDGVRIRVAHWPGPRHAMILPGRTEYIEKYGLVVRDLAAAGWGAFVIDWRGQGLADRLLPDVLMGHVDRFSDYQADLEAALSVADAVAPGPKPWLMHSMGGCIGLRAMIDGKRPPSVSFSAPMLGLAQPGPLLGVLRGLAGVLGPLGLDRRYAPTTGPRFGLPGMDMANNNLTTDRAQFDRMKAQITEDPRLALGGPSLRWMAEAIEEMAALAARPSPMAPALFGLGGGESIVSGEAIRDRVFHWPGAEFAWYDGARHELLMERPETRDDFLGRTLALFDRSAG
jgi:lysophospholipase